MYDTPTTLHVLSAIDGIIYALEGHQCPKQDIPGLSFVVPLEDQGAISFLQEFGSQLHVLPRGLRRDRFVSLAPRFPDACYLLRAELEWLLDYDPKIATFPAGPCIRFLKALLAWPPEKFVKFAKYHTASGFAMYIRNELPENPDPEVFRGRYDFLLWSGPFRRFLKARLTHRNDTRHLRLFWGLLQGVKRGCRVVPADFEIGALADHAEILSRPAPELELDPATEQAWESIEKSSLLSSVQEVRPAPSFEASRSASSESKRSTGGLRQYLRELLGGGKMHSMTSALNARSSLIRMYEVAPGVVQEIRDEGLEEVDWELWPKLYDSLTRDPKPHVSYVQTVLEPLKVRIITKGEALSAYYLHPFQDAMWRMLRERMPAQFSLIGEVLTDHHLAELLRREMEIYLIQDTTLSTGKRRQTVRSLFNYMNEEGFWVSGDYKAATDNLNLNATLRVLGVFLQKMRHDKFMVRPYSDDPDDPNMYPPVPLGPTELLVAFRSLGRQTLVYPKQYTNEIAAELTARLVPWRIQNGAVAVDMRNGQLMGSILSFPILCFINFWAYYASFIEWYQTFPSRSLHDAGVPIPEKMPVLINGDDIAFRADNRLYGIWKAKISQFGLKLSVGKNYTHPGLVTINSKLFVYRPKPWVAQEPWTPFAFEEIPFMNVGLLIGQTKLQGKAKKKTIGSRAGAESMPLNGQYNAVMEGARDPIRAHNRFVHYHRERIQQETRGGYYNLFLPPCLYGLGFVNHAVVDTSVYTFTQRKLAGYKMSLISSYSTAEYREHRTISELLRGLIYVTDKYMPDFPVMQRSGAVVLLSKEDLGAREPDRYVTWKDYVQIRQPPFFGIADAGRPDYTITYPRRRELREILSKDLTMPRARALKDFEGDYHVWVDLKALAVSPSDTSTMDHAVLPLAVKVSGRYRGLFGEPFMANERILGGLLVTPAGQVDLV